MPRSPFAAKATPSSPTASSNSAPGAFSKDPEDPLEKFDSVHDEFKPRNTDLFISFLFPAPVYALCWKRSNYGLDSLKHFIMLRVTTGLLYTFLALPATAAMALAYGRGASDEAAEKQAAAVYSQWRFLSYLWWLWVPIHFYCVYLAVKSWIRAKRVTEGRLMAAGGTVDNPVEKMVPKALIKYFEDALDITGIDFEDACTPPLMTDFRQPDDIQYSVLPLMPCAPIIWFGPARYLNMSMGLFESFAYPLLTFLLLVPLGWPVFFFMYGKDSALPAWKSALLGSLSLGAIPLNLFVCGCAYFVAWMVWSQARQSGMRPEYKSS